MSNITQPHDPEQSLMPVIRRARFDRLTLYDVTESELDILEKGSPDSTYLNFAIFLLSVALSFTITLITTTTVSTAVFIIFVVVTVVGYIGGFLLLILWRRNRSSVSDCIKVIRKRLPAEGIQERIPPIGDHEESRG